VPGYDVLLDKVAGFASISAREPRYKFLRHVGFFDVYVNDGNALNLRRVFAD